MGVEFTDNSIQVKGLLEDACEEWLEEAAGEVEAQVKRNQTRVDTGQTKGGWTHTVDRSAKSATIGNPLENAIWEEYGTGEYALEGGRKGGWVYRDAKGEFHRTLGKTPLRPLFKGFNALKQRIKASLESKLKGGLS